MKRVRVQTHSQTYEVAYNDFSERDWGVILTYVEGGRPVTKYIPWSFINEATVVIV